MSEAPTHYDSTTPCAVCGDDAQESHHTTPRGRGGGDMPTARVCRRCHDRLEPEGAWSLKPRDGFWVTANVRTGEVVCRRPIEPRAEKSLVALHMALDLLDPRDEGRRFLQLLSVASDDELAGTDGHLGEMALRLKYGRMLVRHEMWLRHPGKGEVCGCEHPHAVAVHDVALKCEVAERTILEDVQAAKLYIADDGKPMPDSWYRVACHADDEFEALGKAREMFGEGKSVREFRETLNPSGPPDICECPTCGNRHRARS